MGIRIIVTKTISQYYELTTDDVAEAKAIVAKLNAEEIDPSQLEDDDIATWVGESDNEELKDWRLA